MWLEHEVKHSPPSSAEAKSEGSYTSPSPVCLHSEDRDSFILHLYKLITET